MTLFSQVESLLLLATKPMKKKALIKATKASEVAIDEVIKQLQEKYSGENTGIRVIVHDDALQFSTAPENADLVEKVYQSEMTGELTKPALETLSIIAYRGPITKPELELIRGINCSMILRNLSMRGLIKSHAAEDDLLTAYTVDPQFLQFLGLTSLEQLPEYTELHSHELLEQLLQQRTNS